MSVPMFWPSCDQSLQFPLSEPAKVIAPRLGSRIRNHNLPACTGRLKPNRCVYCPNMRPLWNGWPQMRWLSFRNAVHPEHRAAPAHWLVFPRTKDGLEGGPSGRKRLNISGRGLTLRPSSSPLWKARRSMPRQPKQMLAKLEAQQPNHDGPSMSCRQCPLFSHAKILQHGSKQPRTPALKLHFLPGHNARTS